MEYIPKYIWIDIKSYLFNRELWDYPEIKRYNEVLKELPRPGMPIYSIFYDSNQDLCKNKYKINNYVIYEIFFF